MKCTLFKHFPNKPWFLCVCSTSPLKTLWEKEKLLVTSNFSFSHSVFYPFQNFSAVFIKLEIVVCKLFQFGRLQNLSLGKELKTNEIMHGLLCVYTFCKCFQPAFQKGSTLKYKCISGFTNQADGISPRSDYASCS